MLLVSLLAAALCVPAFAITESEVEAQVAASSKAEVAGNVLIWFLCAVAFLKVSQKIDSFMASLGVNVGRTGGSLLAEAMVAMRAVTMVVSGGRGARGGGHSGASGSAGSGGGNSGWFLKGGLAGVVNRHVTNSAVKTATNQTSAVHTMQSSVRQSAAATAAAASPSEAPHGPGVSVDSSVHTGGVDIHAGGSAVVGAPPKEGVIVTDGGASPSIAPSANTPSSTDQDNGAVLNIPQADTSIPDAPGPTEATPIVSQAESVSISESIAASDDGTVLNIPQGDSTAPIGPGIEPSQEGVVITGSERQSNTQSSTNTQTATTTQTVTGAQTATNRQTEQTSSASSIVDRTHTTTNRTHHTHASAPMIPSLGGAIFSKSLAAGGSFANDIIGTVARGEVAGSITGDMAAQSLSSYMGHTAIQETTREAPRYSDVEIGRGRITGVETAAGSSEGLPFAMYHVEQYAVPQGEFQKIFTADGTQWYKQYAQDAVERKPYMADGDKVAYHEKIIKKMPDPPKRKDRI